MKCCPGLELLRGVLAHEVTEEGIRQCEENRWVDSASRECSIR